jgi:hypothetical protein
MVSTRKFYRTVFTFEILSEDPITQGLDLKEIAQETDEGSWSGRFLDSNQEEVDGRRMAELLTEQDSDPMFFMLDNEGNDVD